MTTAHKNRSFRQRLGFAFAGMGHALGGERSFRTQVVILLIVLLGLSWLQPPPVWWALVSLCAAGVLAAELFNTAIEHLADHVRPELHPQIRLVKDCAAAAVLCAVLGSVGVAIALMVELTHRG